MTNVIPMFAFEGHQLRGVKIDGEPWFVAADVCKMLGLNLDRRGQPNVVMALKKLHADECGFSVIETSRDKARARHSQRMRIVSRPGLLSLIKRANKPEAVRIERWINHEVLPSIMDTGAYVAADATAEGVKQATEAAPQNTKRTDLDLLRLKPSWV